MRTPWIRTIVAPVIALSLAGCDGTTEPNAELVDMVLDFCSDETPTFFAYQNDQGVWTRVAGDANGTFSFRTPAQMALAIVHQVGSASSSEFIYTTASELQGFNNVACTESAGTKNLNGTLAGLPAGSVAMIAMANAFAYVEPPLTTYTLEGLPNGPIDLIAQRDIGVTTTTPDRVIIRRDQNLASTIPVLDFSTSEAVSLATNSLTITGLSGSEDNFLRHRFQTTSTFDHSIAELDFFTASTQTLYHIPSTMTEAGDLHELDVWGRASSGTSYRGELQYYRVAGNRTMSLGSALNAPMITQASGAPYVRLRAQLASQQEYGSLVSAYYDQSITVNSGRIVVVTMTAGYLNGTPATWTLDIPDLSNVSGFPTTAMLQPGSTVNWWVDAYGGQTSAFFGKPSDGATLDYAGRTSTVAAAQQYRVDRQRTRSRGPATLSRREALGAFR